jgi:hypothetical protein
VLPGIQNADEGGVHDADEWSGKSGINIGKVSSHVGKVSR